MLLYPFEWKDPQITISILLIEQISLLKSSSSYLIGVPRGFLSSNHVYPPNHPYLVVDIDNQIVCRTSIRIP